MAVRPWSLVNFIYEKYGLKFKGKAISNSSIPSRREAPVTVEAPVLEKSPPVTLAEKGIFRTLVYNASLIFHR